MGNKPVISRKKKFVFSLVTGLFAIGICFFCYAGYAAYQTIDIYKWAKSNPRGWKGNVHAADPELGFAPVPNSQGAHVFPIGPDIPMRYDSDGFRVPVVPGKPSPPRPLVLSLGCSFTYGDAMYAEKTFPYLVGQSLNGTTKNAGVCSYGLAQMLVLARKLVPLHKPDYLLVQYSPWLVERAQKPSAPSYFGIVPVPYFYKKKDRLAIYPPVFQTRIMDLPVSRYRDTPSGFFDALSFYWHVGLPLAIHDDFNVLKFTLQKKAGIVPPPAKSQEELIKYVYGEISEVARKCGTKVVIVVLGNSSAPVPVNRGLLPSDALLVNAQDALLARLPVADDSTYERLYAHWRGVPPNLTLVDSHPNELAHQIIADTVVSAIRKSPAR
jgi:hypothetical protein